MQFLPILIISLCKAFLTGYTKTSVFYCFAFFIGIRLIYGVIDNVLSWKQMMEFRDFLQLYHFPLPLVSAVVSVYAQFIAGLLFVLGFKTRYAALLMILNFLVALLMVHRGHTFEQMTPALTMVFAAFFFCFRVQANILWMKEQVPDAVLTGLSFRFLLGCA